MGLIDKIKNIGRNPATLNSAVAKTGDYLNDKAGGANKRQQHTGADGPDSSPAHDPADVQADDTVTGDRPPAGGQPPA
ncbi:MULTISPECIES: hypothetical protein [unclassified Dietzia]|uniref:hypothetical protein n=1 Tax=unclassified Dietzia TaxID=2617939 RepID=UPI000D2036D3|nr:MULTISPECIES: hypothetical protein [unclassified Dietzia]AVZ40540.1 hypothetical protein CT688_14755 [Dietzia sp. JS16-p6b]QGW26076.1 hypothetical protein GJR88_04686 [Dietzia sp. DQ12-45-1b]